MKCVLNVLLTHQAPEELTHVLKRWRSIVPETQLLLVHGGKYANFESISHRSKIFIDDPRLRITDQQRGKHTHESVLKAVSGWLASRKEFTHVYYCEYDHIPLVSDLNQRQLQLLSDKQADVLAHHLARIDGTSHPHFLYHVADQKFVDYWRTITVRPNPKVVLSMFGSGSFWKRDAFTAVAELPQSIDAYMELYLPTLAHHLGYRVVGYEDLDRWTFALPSRNINMTKAKKDGAWVVHPIKNLGDQLLLEPRAFF